MLLDMPLKLWVWDSLPEAGGGCAGDSRGFEAAASPLTTWSQFLHFEAPEYAKRQPKKYLEIQHSDLKIQGKGKKPLKFID